MGFHEGDVCEALRAEHYNSDQAVDFLIQGYIPSPTIFFQPEGESFESGEKTFNFEEEDEEELIQYEIYRKFRKL
jgi:hypothetical protein